MATQIRLEPILPKRHNFPLVIADQLEKEIENTLRGYIRSTLVRAFYKRMTNWKQKPDITGRFDRRAYRGNLTGFALVVSPSGRNKRLWVFVSGGVPQHIIAPRRAGGSMTIKGGVHGYRPRTMPGDYYGGPGDYDPEGTFRTRNAVKHPGVEAREFEKHIASSNEDDFVRVIAAAVKRALR